MRCVDRYVCTGNTCEILPYIFNTYKNIAAEYKFPEITAGLKNKKEHARIRIVVAVARWVSAFVERVTECGGGGGDDGE